MTKMRKKFFLWVFLLIGLAAAAAGGMTLTHTPQETAQSHVVNAMNLSSNLQESPDYERATAPRELSFPADHGAHPDFQTEWWYFTGNLDTTDGRHFGYQLTFFRRALLPKGERASRISDFTADQVFMAHFALTDVSDSSYHAYERFSRAAAGLAGADAAPFQVWLDDWKVAATGTDRYQLSADQDGIVIKLELRDAKGVILQGIDGYSQKGPDPGNASYYYSMTRLVSSGTVQIGADQYSVTGLSWMDHEFSTSALSLGQVGWDWFSIQLVDQTEIMFFQIRHADGTKDPYSIGNYVAEDRKTLLLTPDRINITVQSTWRSPKTKAVYPSRWSFDIPDLDLKLEITPYLNNQELNKSYSYWEGAVQVAGTKAGKPVSGSGYIELTGYAGSMSGQF
jgi:predicted secreted hydrolase